MWGSPTQPHQPHRMKSFAPDHTQGYGPGGLAELSWSLVMPTAAAQKPVLGLLRVLGHCQDTCAAPSRQGVGVPRTARDGKCWPGFISSFELLVWKRLELEWAAGVQHHRTIEWPRSEGILKITMFQSPATGRDPADTWPDGAEAGAAELSCELGLGLACGKTFLQSGWHLSRH